MVNRDFIWNKKAYQEFVKYLYTKKNSNQFLKFNSKIIVTKHEMIGIKVPVLKKIAKDISKTDIFCFLGIVQENTYEEIMLEGLVISYIKDYNTFKKYFNHFIKKIDNWSICDVCISSMRIIKKHQNVFFKEIKQYLKSKEEFIIRVGVVLLLNYYIEDKYIDEIFILIDSIDSEYYYANMAIAWLVSVCFIKEKEKTIEYLNNNNLNHFIYNKAIQKIIESLRVNDEDKIMLKKMKKRL